MSVSTLPLAPETPVSGAGGYGERLGYTLPPPGVRLGAAAAPAEHAWYRAVTDPDIFAWLAHVAPAAGCTHPIRLAGQITTLDAATGRLLSTVGTASMPDGIIYKPCGNRRATACPSCAGTYRRDAYHLIRAGMVGGKGVPASVATHPAVFATLTAPSFGAVHTRAVTRHTCTGRGRCDCRPEPCHPRRNQPVCVHGQPMFCYARHETGDSLLGQPLCLDCYDHGHQVVWNHLAGELWRRTCITTLRAIRRTAKARGVHPRTIRLSFGKVAEMQRRGVVHYHAIIRLDAIHPADPHTVLFPPATLGVGDLADAIAHAAAATTAFATDPHPAQGAGWAIGWGAQVDIRPVTLSTGGDITDSMVAGYFAKYATKSTEATGHLSRRITSDTIDLHADADGSHTERLVDACWTLGQPSAWRGLRRWAHMLGFGGHFLTKSRRYSVTFRLLRERRIIWRRTQPPPDTTGTPPPVEDATLVINFLDYVGAGWHTTGDALLANSAAARARERQHVAREELATAA